MARTPEERATLMKEVHRMHADGISVPKISRRLGVPYTTVYLWCFCGVGSYVGPDNGDQEPWVVKEKEKRIEIYQRMVKREQPLEV